MLRNVCAAAVCLGTCVTVQVSAADTRQAVIDPSIRTLRVEKEGDFMSPPVITLGSGERIVITFDEISDDYSRLRYRLLHCNADWQPSRLIESEYLDGFNEAPIEDFAFSSNTYVHYVNYRLAIPSDDMRPTVSGNYVVEIYREDNPDDIVARARFSVSEELAHIAGDASTRTDRGVNGEWQQLTLRLEPGIKDINPYSDIILSISQNGRPDTERQLLHPMRVEGSTVVYDHQPELIFPAGNEYRRFETVRADYPGMGVDSVTFSGRNYHSWLRLAEARADRQYSFDSTQRGRYVIDEYNATDPELGADYVTVHFTLDFPELIGADVYVEGDLADRMYTARNRMTYDRDRHVYTLSMPLKQGSYNYQYVVLPHSSAEAANASSPPAFSKAAADASLIEGDKYETVNEYDIKVYLRLPIARADRLIGSATIVSNR